MGILHDSINGLTSTEGKEIFRYFSIAYKSLVSVRSNGALLEKKLGGEWKVWGRKNDDTNLDDWMANMKVLRAKLPKWAFVSDLPFMADIDDWLMDGDVETLSGDIVEPDGRGPDGAPSWLLALGLM